eukprot:TRINITY_DN4104_c0_g1_i1.p1 TRINITY_DN4104_c0_g1~~TRINITY_DN4104_c0_g1_i1.p1  ORF type:complete len:446 (-),score=70.37 TRINITY_DN4104_c0_g1_i1:68-1246(-)
MGYIENPSGLTSYKGGTTIDNSLIYNYIISPWCNNLVNYIPRNVAPNVLTALGLLSNVLAFVLAAVYLGDQPEDPPRWVFLAIGVLFFMYMLLDNLDGKQARRTGTSSPLGELMDHGCDSITVSVGSLTSGLIIKAGLWQSFSVFAVGCIPFYLAHWEEYFTNNLILGYIGPTEAEILVSVLCTINFFFGYGIWSSTLPIPLPVINLPFLPPIDLKTIELRTYFVFWAALSSLWIVLTYTTSALKKARAVNIKLETALLQLVPFTTSYFFGFLWLYTSPELYIEHPYMVTTSFGFVFAYLVCRCIVQRICSEDFKLFYYVTIPLIVGSINSFFAHITNAPHILPEKNMLGLVWLATFLFFAHFVVSIIREMCSILKIQAFSTAYATKKTKSR